MAREACGLKGVLLAVLEGDREKEREKERERKKELPFKLIHSGSYSECQQSINPAFRYI